MAFVPLLTHDDIEALDKRGMRNAAISALMMMEAHRHSGGPGVFWSKERKEEWWQSRANVSANLSKLLSLPPLAGFDANFAREWEAKRD